MTIIKAVKLKNCQKELSTRTEPINVMTDKTDKSHNFSIIVTPENFKISSFSLVKTIPFAKSPLLPGSKEFKENAVNTALIQSDVFI